MFLLTNKKQAEIGKLIWFANLQWFIVQFIVSLSWKDPGYSWKNNMVSDLGNTVISPLAGLMNFSFVLTGILSFFGALFLRKFLFKNIQGANRCTCACAMHAFKRNWRHQDGRMRHTFSTG